MEAYFSVQGFDLLEKQLQEFGVEVAQRSLAKVAKEAFEPVLWAARSLAPDESGELRDAIQQATVKPKSGESVAVTGLKIGRGTNPGDGGAPASRRWHLAEFGTAHAPAHPFLRPALDQNAQEVLARLKKLLAEEVIRLSRRRK